MSKQMSTFDRIVKAARDLELDLLEQKRFVRIQKGTDKNSRRIYMPIQDEPAFLDVAGWEPTGEGIEVYAEGKAPSGSVRCRLVPGKCTWDRVADLMAELDGPVTVQLKKNAPKGKERPSLAASLARLEDASE